MSGTRFNPSDFLGLTADIYATDFKTITTVHGDKKAAVADVYITQEDDTEVAFTQVLIFNVGIVSDLRKAADNEVHGTITRVQTKGVDEDGNPRFAIVVK